MHCKVYSGCGRRELVADPKLVTETGDMFNCLGFPGAPGKPDPTQGGNPLKDPEPNTKPSKSKKSKKKKNNACPAADATVNQTNVKMYAYEIFGHVEQTVARYLELAKKSKDSLNREGLGEEIKNGRGHKQML